MRGAKRTLILLDGTWKKAYKMWQLSINLQALPTVSLDNADRGNYRIRKSPKDQGVSTVEAGYLALAALEGGRKVLPIDRCFQSDD